MEENEYRSTYHAINRQRCHFEKAILSRRCTCMLSNRFCLADREGVACQSEPASLRCRQLLGMMRDKALFALKLTQIDAPLPHAKEIRVQTGGMLGLQKLVNPTTSEAETVENIAALVARAMDMYGSLENFPYQELVRSIVSFKGRPKHSRRGD